MGQIALSYLSNFLPPLSCLFLSTQTGRYIPETNVGTHGLHQKSKPFCALQLSCQMSGREEERINKCLIVFIVLYLQDTFQLFINRVVQPRFIQGCDYFATPFQSEGCRFETLLWHVKLFMTKKYPPEVASYF